MLPATLVCIINAPYTSMDVLEPCMHGMVSYKIPCGGKHEKLYTGEGKALRMLPHAQLWNFMYLAQGQAGQLAPLRT